MPCYFFQAFTTFLVMRVELLPLRAVNVMPAAALAGEPE